MQVEDPSMAAGQGAPSVIAGSRMAEHMQVKTSAYKEGEDGTYDQKHPCEKGATERPSPVGIDA